VRLVEALREVRCSVAEACGFIGLSRSGYYAARHEGYTRVIASDPGDATLLARIRPISEAHPFWGYRRVWAWLRYREGLRVNKKRVYRLMREASLTVKRTPHAATRTPKAKPHATRPQQFWGIDMTKFLIPTVGWVYLVLVLDWYTKQIVGWDLSLRSRRQEWETALLMGVHTHFLQGVRGAGLKLVSDNGSQPTSTGFMATMSLLGIEQVFTSYDNPKGNAETERLMRTIKEELLWLREFAHVEEARSAIRQWIDVDYNLYYVHSSLGYKSPVEFASTFRPQESLPAAA
jgi:transposase InsO family protein